MQGFILIIHRGLHKLVSFIGIEKSLTLHSFICLIITSFDINLDKKN